MTEIEELAKLLRAYFHMISADSLSSTFWTTQAKNIIECHGWRKAKPADGKALDEQDLEILRETVGYLKRKAHDMRHVNKDQSGNFEERANALQRLIDAKFSPRGLRLPERLNRPHPKGNAYPAGWNACLDEIKSLNAPTTKEGL